MTAFQQPASRIDDALSAKLQACCINFCDAIKSLFGKEFALEARLTLAHCACAEPDELEMIAEAGCTIVTNASSNLALRSGIAPVAEMLKRGCKVAMGIDGQAFDEDADALREIRLLWSLHAGWGFDLAF